MKKQVKKNYKKLSQFELPDSFFIDDIMCLAPEEVFPDFQQRLKDMHTCFKYTKEHNEPDKEFHNLECIGSFLCSYGALFFKYRNMGIGYMVSNIDPFELKKHFIRSLSHLFIRDISTASDIIDEYWAKQDMRLKESIKIFNQISPEDCKAWHCEHEKRRNAEAGRPCYYGKNFAVFTNADRKAYEADNLKSKPAGTKIKWNDFGEPIFVLPDIITHDELDDDQPTEQLIFERIDTCSDADAGADNTDDNDALPEDDQPKSDSAGDVLTYKEAAKLLDIQPQTIRKMVMQGQLHTCGKRGKSCLISFDEIQKYLSAKNKIIDRKHIVIAGDDLKIFYRILEFVKRSKDTMIRKFIKDHLNKL